ncbi:MAG: hypothetical protein HYX63_01520 [Gammaproteobacteria bacterium]|nr:hypothetical protein [Gammaproteobacteria bacterium]
MPKPVDFGVASGTRGIGNASFGAGVSTGFDNEFNHQVSGSGLWAAGIDPSKPGYQQNVEDLWATGKISGFLQGNPNPYLPGGAGNVSPTADQLTNVLDVTLREREKKAQADRRQGGFFDQLGGYIIDNIPAIIGVATGNPWLAVAAGAAQGGVNGGIGGAFLGGAIAGLGAYGGGEGGAAFDFAHPIDSLGNIAAEKLTSINSFIEHPLDTAASFAASKLAPTAANAGTALSLVSDANQPKATPNVFDSLALPASIPARTALQSSEPPPFNPRTILPTALTSVPTATRQPIPRAAPQVGMLGRVSTPRTGGSRAFG